MDTYKGWQIRDTQRYSWVHTLMEHNQKRRPPKRWTDSMKNENILQKQELGNPCRSRKNDKGQNAMEQHHDPDGK